jgi:hypothetical protein
VTARCDHCRKPIRAARGIRGPGDTQFDSVTCREAYVATLQLKGLQNSMRVARSRFKSRVICRMGPPIARSGGKTGAWWSVCFDRYCNE